MRPDDSSVDDGTLGEIREHVDRALRDSGALGVANGRCHAGRSICHETPATGTPAAHGPTTDLRSVTEENAMIRGENVVRPARFERATSWFVAIGAVLVSARNGRTHNSGATD